MIYAVGNNFQTNATQNFGNKNKMINKTAKVVKNVVNEIGEQVDMNVFKQINVQQLQKKASEGQYRYWSPYIPTNINPKVST